MTGIARSCRIWSLAVMWLVLLFTVSSALSQEVKPKTTKGISLKASIVLPLGKQIPELEGYGLQIRTIVLKPGAVSSYHSHAKRPVVAYLVQGDYTEHRDRQGTVLHKPGEQWIEGADVAHWSENRGSEPAYLINVEVVRMQ